MELRPAMMTDIPYGHDGVAAGSGDWRMRRREDMAAHQGDTGDAYVGSRVLVMEYVRSTSYGCQSEPQHVIEARFSSGLTLVQYLLPASDTIHVLQHDAKGTRELGTIKGTLRVPSLDPACFRTKSIPKWVKTTGISHRVSGASVMIQSPQAVQIIGRDGSVTVAPGEGAADMPTPFVAEDELRLPPWMRTALSATAGAGGVTREDDFIVVGGVRVPATRR